MNDSNDIKIVAVDIDGTFLTDMDKGRTYNKELFDRVFDELQRQHVHFVFASGEPYDSLCSIIPDRIQQISYVADNGGRIVDRGTDIFHGQFAPATVRNVAHFLDQLPGVVYTLCGLESSFILLNQPASYRNRIQHYYPNLTPINSLKELHGPIFKFAMNCPQDKTREYCQKILDRFSDVIYPTSSGFGSVDLIIPGLDKASGLTKLMQRWDLHPNQLAAFGDGGNDVTMLQLAKYSYAMANAPKDVKQVASKIAPSNNDQGVLKVLAKHFNVKTEENDND